MVSSAGRTNAAVRCTFERLPQVAKRGCAHGGLVILRTRLARGIVFHVSLAPISLQRVKVKPAHVRAVAVDAVGCYQVGLLTGAIMYRIAILICAALWATSATAQEGQGFLDGNTLYQRCTGQTVERTFCRGYVAAAADAAERQGAMCSPLGATLSQFADVATQYLASHPAARHYAAYDELWLAFREAFPCASKQTSVSR
jgi:Rap1a immunity proteins